MAKDVMINLGAETGSFQKAMKQAADSIKGLQDSVRLIDFSAFTYIGNQALNAAEKFSSFYEMGAKAQAVTDSFNRIAAASGLMGSKIVEAMRSASNETVTDVALMTKAQQLMVEGFSPDQIVALTEAARVAAQKMGITVAEAFNLISEAVIRGNLRGQIREAFPMEVAETLDKFARTLGVTGPLLSETGRQQAIYNEIIKQSNDYIKRYGELTESSFEKHQQLVAGATHFWENLGGAIANAFNWLVKYAMAGGEQPYEGYPLPKTPAAIPSAAPVSGTVGAGVAGTPGKVGKAADKSALIDQEKLNALLIERRGIILSLEMGHAKSVGDINAEVELTKALGKLEIDRLAQQKKLTPEMKTQIELGTEDKVRLIEEGDRYKQIVQEISAMEANAEENWGVEKARGELRDEEDKRKEKQNISDMDYQSKILALRGDIVGSLQLQGQVEEANALLEDKLFDTTKLKEYNKLLVQQATTAYQFIQGFGEAISSSFSSNLSQMLQGTETFAAGIKKLWADLESYVITKITQMAANYALFGNVKGTFTSGSGLLGSIGGLLGLQGGGIVTRPTLAMVGESGPEAVIPLSEAKSGGGQNTITVVNINAIDAKSFEDRLRNSPGPIMEVIYRSSKEAGSMRNIIKGG